MSENHRLKGNLRVNSQVFETLLERVFDGSQKMLAAKAGLDKNVVSRAGLGEAIRCDNLVKISRALELDRVEDLIHVDDLLSTQASSVVEASKVPVCMSDDSPLTAPHLASRLVGRENDLVEIHRRLEESAPRQDSQVMQVIVPIRGLPGVGKTAVAANLWYSSRGSSSRYRQTLYASVGNVAPNRMRARLLSILQTWGRLLEERAAQCAESVTEAASMLRNALAEQAVFVVLDDVWDADVVRSLMVGGPGSATLVTTRDNEIARTVTHSQSGIYTLNCLGEAESFELLETLAGSVVREHRHECLSLVAKLDGLPLALQIAGRELLAAADRHEDIPLTIASILDLGRLILRKLPLSMDALLADASPTVAALLSKSTQRLSPDDLHRFVMLGHLPPEPATFTSKFMASVWSCPQDAAAKTVSTFEARGLIECVGPDRFQLHGLLKVFAQVATNFGTNVV